MKRITLSLIALAIGASVHAQPPHHTRLPKPLVAELKLTPEQQVKVTDILKNKNFEMDSLVKKSHIGRGGKMTGAKMKSAETEADDQLYAILTKDQQVVYAQWVINRRAQMAKMGPPPPHPSM